MGNPTANHTYWAAWARFLQQRGLAVFAARLIEATGPLAFVGAQAIYLGQPLFGPPGNGSGLQAMAEMLENRTELQDFAAFLREEPIP
ncbi:MAG TPA: hypothetical protein VGJ97_04740 [Anaerolineaceae bacterium]|jgi:hypothetical protein